MTIVRSAGTSKAGEPRSVWVSYLRVRTAEQAERDLSLPAQRRAVEDYAARAEQPIRREYLEEGCSGTNMNRRAFRQMLEDVFCPGSDIGTIVVHHTSRFTRNATEARVVKEKLRREGVRVVSVCQETNDDPVGQLIEGIFECIDQYESEVNGMRTSAAMREAVRQGYFPGARVPFGFVRKKIEIRPNVFRSRHRARCARGGDRSCALPALRRWQRREETWRARSTRVSSGTAVGRDGAKTLCRWRAKRRKWRSESKWLKLKVEPIVEQSLYELAMKLRSAREPRRNPGKPASKANLLAGIVHCGRCGASCQLETSGKRVKGERYQYRHYNCRTFCRIGRAECPGGRSRATTSTRSCSSTSPARSAQHGDAR